jgi:hypothetical protein
MQSMVPPPRSRDQDAHVFAADAPAFGHAAPSAWWAPERARPFLRFEQEHFVRFGNTGQGIGPIMFCQQQKTVAPAKTGVAVHADLVRRGAHGAAVEHAAQVVEPFAAVTQPRQGRATQGVEGAPALAATIALDAPVAAVAVAVPAAAGGTAGRRPRVIDGRADPVEPDRRPQKLEQLFALAPIELTRSCQPPPEPRRLHRRLRRQPR